MARGGKVGDIGAQLASRRLSSLKRNPLENPPWFSLIEIRAQAVPARRGRSKRGETSGDKTLDVTDAVLILHHLFRGDARLGCLISADVNGDGDLDITDPIYLLRYLYLGAAVPPEPFASCGTAESGSSLTCESSPVCE